MSQESPVAPDADLQDRLCLSLVAGVGPKLQRALIGHFGDAGAVLAASASQLRRVPGIGGKLSETIARAREDNDVAAELALCRASGIQVLTPEMPEYPQRLLEIYDPPGILYARGELRGEDALTIGIVGSRHATHYGATQAERLASALVRAGYTVASGLARGIDAAAHRGALVAGGRTVAVLGSGLLNIYPPEHVDLADEVASSGVLLSEAPPRARPLAGAFPQRNRLISGLSLGIIVIEASLRSGALITARHAMEQGREVFAVPGRIDNPLSKGCHALIRDGAKLIESVDDVLEELGPLARPAPTGDGRTIQHPVELQLNEIEQQVLAAIPAGATTIDEVVRASRLATPQVLATISALEMRRVVRRLGGNTIARA
jgi:DNA processing protein